MKALILGAKGNLGQDLVRRFTTAGHEAVGLDRKELDVTDSAAVRQQVLAGGYDAVVNAVAWNDVDGAEDPANLDRVLELNAAVPGVIAAAAAKAGAAFVHYSTDYVFDGSRPGGYREDDEPRPLSVYGRSKLEGERVALAAGGRVYVCRTSKLYGTPGLSTLSKPSFVHLMLKLAATKPELSIVDEEVGMPTFTEDLAGATVRLLEEGHAPGIYHLVNEGEGVTWYGFAEEIFRLQDITVPRRAVPSSAFPTKAERPKYAKLLNTKFPPLRDRIEALEDFLCRATVGQT
ncbi:hypothetical protein AMJ57_01375 [Parcubacteria bacterium SG8_24]|nr:MAG: hypothetical protein AMJ57_01375 [Parcubacteria bacterium SG8_24]